MMLKSIGSQAKKLLFSQNFLCSLPLRKSQSYQHHIPLINSSCHKFCSTALDVQFKKIADIIEEANDFLWEDKFKEATEKYETALEISINMGPDAQDGRVSALMGLVSSYCRQKDFEKAFDCLDRAYGIARIDNKLEDILDLFYLFGKVYHEFGKLEDAFSFVEAILKLYQQYALKEDQRLDQTLLLQGFILYYKKEYEKARDVLLSCKERFGKMIFPDKDKTFFVIDLHLASIFIHEENYARAIKFIERTFLFKRESINMPGVVISQFFSHIIESPEFDDVVLSTLSDYARETKEIIGPTDIKEKIKELKTVFLSKVKEEFKTFESLIKAVERYEELPSTEKCNEASNYADLGIINAVFDNLDDSAHFYEKASDVSMEVLGKGHRSVGIMHICAGEAFLLANKNRKSEAHFRKALSIFEGTLGKQHPLYIDTKEKVKFISKNKK